MRVAWLKDLRMADLEQVGGKNASLGEMMSGLAAAGIRVPGGFATTADAFREFLAANGLDKKIAQRVGAIDTNDVQAHVKSYSSFAAMMKWGTIISLIVAAIVVIIISS